MRKFRIKDRSLWVVEHTAIKVILFYLWIGAIVAFAPAPSFGQETSKKASVISGKITEINLPGFLLLKVPAGALPAGQVVGVSKTQSKGTADDFKTSAEIYPKGVRRVPYEFRVNTGKTLPAHAMEVTAYVPKNFKKQFSGKVSLGAFVQFMSGGEAELLDNFESVVSTFDPVHNSVRFTLEPEAFTNSRNQDHTYEAIIVIAGQPLR